MNQEESTLEQRLADASHGMSAAIGLAAGIARAFADRSPDARAVVETVLIDCMDEAEGGAVVLAVLQQILGRLDDPLCGDDFSTSHST